MLVGGTLSGKHTLMRGSHSETFRVSRGTFTFILDRIRHVLERQNVVEEPIPPELRLAICLYRLGRGSYYFTIAEMSGLGLSTVCAVTKEVCRVIVELLWEECLKIHAPIRSRVQK